MSKIIGIDLGTSNSGVAVVDEHEIRVVENSAGSRSMPSVVAFRNGETLVGQSAKRQAVTNPTNTLFAVKRLMGREFTDEMIRRGLSVPYTIAQAWNGDAWVEVNGVQLAPPQVSAEVLKQLKQAAEDYLGESVREAVIAVPASFDELQRKATKDAARIAGLNVKRIINESTAAALAYGMDKQRGDSKIAVFDLGGGAFDISIIEITEVDGEDQFEVFSTNGDTFLGGEDFDVKIIEHLADQFQGEHGIDLNDDPVALQRLKEAAEKAKIELSSSTLTDVNLPHIAADHTGPKHLATKLTRAEVEVLVEDLVGRTMGLCGTALAEAGLQVGDIDEVILVGGQTRMPLVRERVAAFFFKEPRKDVSPDEAVAVGAAIQAAMLTGDVTNMLVMDVTPLSLGVETLGGMMNVLIEKNTTIPARKQQVYSTAEDDQTTVTIHVLQGEHQQAAQNKSLGRFDLADIPPAPRGEPQIEVSFDIDASGILHVVAEDKATGAEQSLVKASGGLSEDEIEKMMRTRDLSAQDARPKAVACSANVHREIATDAAGDNAPDGQNQAVETAAKDALNVGERERDGVSPGKRIDDYRVKRLLGRGGFGEVYLAENVHTGVDYAVKVFRPSDENVRLATSSREEGLQVLRERFLHEARTLQDMGREAAVVDVGHVGVLGTGEPYYVMPYYPKSLADRIGKDVFERGAQAELPEAERPRALAYDEGVRVLEQVLQGLAAAHGRGIVHRDVKPSNVLLDGEGNACVADFGIAKVPDSGLTASGMGMGSRAYMAREQRESARHVDARADVYSFGRLAYRVLTGQLPDGRYAAPMEHEPRIGQALNDVIESCLEELREARPPTAADVLENWRAALAEGRGGAAARGGETVSSPRLTSTPAEQTLLQTHIVDALLARGDVAHVRGDLETLALAAGLDEGKLDSLIEELRHEHRRGVDAVQTLREAVDNELSRSDGEFSERGHELLRKVAQSKGLEDRLDELAKWRTEVYWREHESSADAASILRSSRDEEWPEETVDDEWSKEPALSEHTTDEPTRWWRVIKRGSSYRARPAEGLAALLFWTFVLLAALFVGYGVVFDQF